MAKTRPGLSYLDNPDVRAQIRAAAAYTADKARRDVIEECEVQLIENPVGSPIEAIFVAWWFAHARAVHEDALTDPEIFGQCEVECEGAKYRLDFVVSLRDPDLFLKAEKYRLRTPRIGVELDGHEFHERTKEQVTYRNKRDRDLQTAGWHLFHFSGSELVKDPRRCVAEVYQVGQSAYQALFCRVLEAQQAIAPLTGAAAGRSAGPTA